MMLGRSVETGMEEGKRKRGTNKPPILCRRGRGGSPHRRPGSEATQAAGGGGNPAAKLRLLLGRPLILEQARAY